MNITCLIVDDEPRAHVILRHYMSKMEGVTYAGSVYDAIAGYNYLKKNDVDLILLDVNMPEVDGFSLLEMIDPKPMVIITTAYTDYAFKSFEYNAIDYLHKPIRFERFLKAIEKARKWKAVNNPSSIERSIELKIDGYLQKINTADIIYIESLGNYSKIICASKELLVLSSMKFFEQKLFNTSFIRIHKSYMVNACYVKQLDESSLRIAEIRLPIGKTYKKYIKTSLSKDELLYRAKQSTNGTID